jgi:hypothetical protein
MEHNLLRLLREGPFATVLTDPPWRFTNETGKIAPEHHRLARYPTIELDEIAGSRRLRNPDQLRRRERYRPSSSLERVKIGRRSRVKFGSRLTHELLDLRASP